MNIETFFYDHPVFRKDEFISWKEKDGGTNPVTIRNILQYHANRGRIMNIRRGLYAVVPPNANADTYSVDSYLIAGRITEDSVIAYHSALEIHGLAYTIYNQRYFKCAAKIKPFSFDGQWFQAMPHSEPGNTAGIVHMNRQGLDIAVTSIEHTFVDVLNRMDICGGWEEVSRSLSGIVALNAEQVARYCLSFDNRILAAKVGYFLELRDGPLSVDTEVIKALQAHKPKNPHSLVSRKGPFNKGKFIKNWNIIVPYSVFNQSWEEPNYDV
ncbi:TPA: type IV toxin-antitoxin system AbiEi family antitoxin domain-containing protein [Legionella pneumophila]